MEDPQTSLALASRHFDNGQIKDAYSAFLSTAQNVLKPLFDVKFVHCSIVSKPQNSAVLLSVLHSCVDHIEKIIEYHSPSAAAIKPPPPLPPKPSHVSKPVLPPKPTSASVTPIPSTTTPLDVKSSVSHKEKVTPLITQHHTRSNTSLQLDLSSKEQKQIQLQQHPEYPHTTDVPDGEIDPTHLVPAQTSNNDSLTPTTVSGVKTDHIPHIPVPPLLTTHRILQAKLLELESSLKEYRARKQQLSCGEELASNHQMTENEINEAISKYTPFVAEAKHTLNRVRTLYMCAATVPSILHFTPGLVAYQITRIESAIFLAIPSHALLSHAPKSPHPRIVASTDFFNYVTRLIEHSILLPHEASSRAQHINHWIKIASKCQDLNNYQTLKAIVSALGTPPVQRLKRTWGFIPKKSMIKFEAMSELMSEHNNYGKYREHMGIVNTSVLNGKSVHLIQSEHFKRPTVPFLGTFIHDMTYLLAAVGQQQQKGDSSIPQIPLRTSSRQYQGNVQTQHQDPRISKLLDLLVKFQATPKYDRQPNPTNAKMIQKSLSQSRPSLSQAIHRSKTSFGRLGGAIGFGSSSTINTVEGNTTNDYPNSSNNGDSCYYDGVGKFGDEFDTEEQQNLVTQFLLMRSWVSQNTVDELSLLREPLNANNNRKMSGRTSSMTTSSIMSNTSSLMRISSNTPATCSTLTFASSMYDNSRPASFDDYFVQDRSYIYGRNSANTAPLTSSSTLEDNDDEDYDEIIPPTLQQHPLRISSDDNLRWIDPVPYSKENMSAAPVVPPRPSNSTAPFKTVSQ